MIWSILIDSIEWIIWKCPSRFCPAMVQRSSFPKGIITQMAYSRLVLIRAVSFTVHLSLSLSLSLSLPSPLPPNFTILSSLPHSAVHYSRGDGDIHISDLKSRQSPPLSRADAINFPLSKLHSIREAGQHKKFVVIKVSVYVHAPTLYLCMYKCTCMQKLLVLAVLHVCTYVQVTYAHVHLHTRNKYNVYPGCILWLLCIV